MTETERLKARIAALEKILAELERMLALDQHFRAITEQQNLEAVRE